LQRRLEPTCIAKHSIQRITPALPQKQVVRSISNWKNK
jgi:hypothetical protein